MWGAKKKKKGDDELPNQTLALPRELPASVTVEVPRLTFHAVPLSNKGLLSAQMRDGIKALLRMTSGTPVVKMRVFVAGSGDMRRVPAIISEVFTEKRLTLPAVSVVQVGTLPLEGAQIAIEAIAVAKKTVNPNGLALIAGRTASSPNPLDPVGPLAQKVVDELRGLPDATDVVKLTCFTSTLDAKTATTLRTAFPKAALQIMQVVRAPARALVECEAIARLAKTPIDPVNVNGGMARLTAGRVVLTGTQLGFHSEESDIRLAFTRLEKALTGSQVSSADVVYARFYSLTRSNADRVALNSEGILRKKTPDCGNHGSGRGTAIAGRVLWNGCSGCGHRQNGLLTPNNTKL